MNEILGNVYGVMLTWKAISDFAEALGRTTLAYNTSSLRYCEKWFESSLNRLKFLLKAFFPPSKMAVTRPSKQFANDALEG